MTGPITAVIPVSPIKQHPETSILEQTVESVRYWLPDAEILLTFDGVRAEQEDRRQDYEEAIRRILWLAKEWGAVCPFIFDEHKHQTGMLRAVIDEIRTPLLLYCEQDTPLVIDEPIDWEAITNLVNWGHSNLVRLHHEGVIPAEHGHMMHGIDELALGGRFMRTSQWSQRPHVASVAYYRRCLDSYFTPEAQSFIEDKMHGIVDEAYRNDGISGWMQHRLHVYIPGDNNIKRSYHLDGRAGEPKWDSSQTF